MTSMKRCVAITLIVVFSLGATPVIPAAGAQSQANCDAAIERLDVETNKLSSDLDTDVRALVKDEFTENGLKEIRNRLKEKPASEAAFDLRDKWQKFNSWAEITKAFAVTMDDLSKCINTRGCSLLDFAKRQNKATELWIQTLAEGSLNDAGQRVAKAASILKNYVGRTLNVATNGTLQAVNSCVTRFEQQATNTTVNQPSGKSGGGGGAAKTIVLVGAAVGAGLAAAELTKPKDIDTSGFTTTGGGSSTNTGGGSSTPTASGTYSASVVRSCTVGSVNSSPLNPGFIEPCNGATAGGSCDPLNFTVTVSGTTVRDCGPWLTGTLQSNGQFTGNYNGSCGSSLGPAVSGTITSTGGTITGTNVLCRGNNYTISITLRK